MDASPSDPGPGTPLRDARVLAWGLILAVLLAWALALAASAAGLAPGAGSLSGPLTAEAEAGDRGGDPSEAGGAPEVVLVGVPGLTWGMIDDSTPTLQRLAQQGGSAALITRGLHVVTCPADAWLTVGAGQRAGTDLPGCGSGPQSPDDGTAEGEAVADPLEADQIAPDRWESWRALSSAGALEAQVGLLAELAEGNGTCVAAYGASAAPGAARPDGTVARLAPGSRLPTSVGRECRIHLLSAPAVGDPAQGVERLTDIDQALGELADGLEPGTTLLVAGMGHTGERPDALALVMSLASGQETAQAESTQDDQLQGAALTSGSTRQQSLVQLTDLTPTLLALAGIEPPGSGGPAGAGVPFGGAPIAAEPQVDDPVQQAANLAAGVSAAQQVAPVALVLLAVILLPLLLLGGIFRWRRGEGRLLAAAATTSMAVPVATFLAGLVPWWGHGRPALLLAGVILLVAAVVAAVAWAGPWWRVPLGPPAVVAALTAVVLGIDPIWSARLGLVSVTGLQPVTAGRFFGQGNVGFGILLGALLVLLGAALTWLWGRRLEAALLIGFLGLAAAVLNGAPFGGADFGGVPALLAATGLLVLSALGLRWTGLRLVAVGVVAVVGAVAVMALDWLRGPQDRTHLGDFVQSALDGQALVIVLRKLDQSLSILLDYPVAWLVVLVMVAIGYVVARRPSWSAGLWQYAGLWPAAVAMLVALVATWALNDSGLAAVGAALAVLIGAALTVLAQPGTGKLHRTS